jgi:hypothetical protein
MVRAMLSTSSRQRAESAMRRAVANGQGPWPALDAYRLNGGRIGWNDWFRLWKRITQERVEPAAHRRLDGYRPRPGGRPGDRIGIR